MAGVRFTKSLILALRHNLILQPINRALTFREGKMKTPLATEERLRRHEISLFQSRLALLKPPDALARSPHIPLHD